MLNVNDLGYGYCPACKEWKKLDRYHPKDKDILRRKKKKYCVKCIEKINSAKKPFHKIRKVITNHKLMSGGGDYVLSDLLKLRTLQGGACAYCGQGLAYDFSLDHIIPKKFGGQNVLANIILTCASCNSAKQHFELFYFIRRKGYKLHPRVLTRLKGAYDYHDYEYIGTCKDCKISGQARGKKEYCVSCSLRPKESSSRAEKSTSKQSAVCRG